MNQLVGIAPKMVRTKLRLEASALPMIVTILPAQIVGSEKCELAGTVILVIEAPGLEEAEFSTLDINIEHGKSTVEIKALK